MIADAHRRQTARDGMTISLVDLAARASGMGFSVGRGV